MDFELKYNLIQQTPLIHFQHDQVGATLRATEVKPKLDKFIIAKLEKEFGQLVDENGKIKHHKEWFIDDTAALNYKMRIETVGEPTRSEMIDFEIELNHKKSLLRKKKEELRRQYSDEVDSECKRLQREVKEIERKRNAQINGMYFGNMVSNKGNDYDEAVRDAYKETVFYGEKQIKLIIICFIKELREEIEKYVEEFFFVHNFGTRQSKGFGGFVAIEEGKDNKTDVLELLSNNGYRFFYVNVKESLDYDVMLNHAKNIYAVMKSGYNHTNFDNRDSYIKGYIQRCFIDDYIDEETGSDKAFIKAHKRNKKTGVTEQKYRKFIFSRALLGLADYYEFRDGRVEIFSLGENDFDVERFRTPITIKIIDNKLIFLFGSFDKICGKTFYFAPNPKNLDKDFTSFSYEKKKKYILKNVNKKDQYGNSIIVPIETMDKFDDNDVIDFINIFSEYFMEERCKFGCFKKDKSISISKNLEIVVPKELRREYLYE